MLSKIDHRSLSSIEALMVKYGPSFWNQFLGHAGMDTIWMLASGLIRTIFFLPAKFNLPVVTPDRQNHQNGNSGSVFFAQQVGQRLEKDSRIVKGAGTVNMSI
jgi:hypothetical protein